ncbi:peptidoglycan-binding protein [Streptomyces sp. AJS327]|uniref:C40 family peptidase n=1 Tax=Streptomyces sp. AJS327 TaxID=2545265 RepID=UPI0015DD8FCD|nr:peptidoglycan-binding protein [Streptomyces sp. AJS327]MBA0052695.1 peptidoglycan-binding protein [Streptomyces sp. AJS327]
MSLFSQLSRRARISLASAVAGGLAVTGIAIGPSFATAAPPKATKTASASTSAAAKAEPVTRPEVLRRAATWLTANNGSQVPYSQTSVWSDGYRQDCSGYVSMTLGLWKSGPNTVELASNRDLTTPISLKDLKPGDLLIDAEGSNTTRHVVIFEGWTDSSRTAYSAFEQRGGHGTDHRVLTYGLDGGEYKPYRAVNISDSDTPDDPPKDPAPSWPTLKSGSKGTDVTTAQYLLNGHGHRTANDGSFGPDTTSRVKSFQRANGLVADGVVGPKTWAKLVTTVQKGASGNAVRAAQTQLNAQGHQLAVDGEFGPATDEAARGFQKSEGLVVDGSVGPLTWAALLGS